MTMTRIPHSVSFTFNPLVDFNITIFYFATELASCMFTSVYPEIYMRRKIPFQKRLSWNFYQPSGTGIDLGFFEMDNL
ncbi:hypothetical protein RGQ29_014190 [Quercus rubra]|uniref:RING-type E3 ubiquitin transferase n=1 Tax=Quercus rubra TaxID=3512 RepID=A0AAN7J318_QUERU|nr:hypothetical protein RGQ29_014190 [Quercus rubra]